MGGRSKGSARRQAIRLFISRPNIRATNIIATSRFAVYLFALEELTMRVQRYIYAMACAMRNVGDKVG